MAQLPTPTQKTVPSDDIRDHVYAGGMLDKVVTSTEPTYTDRLGGVHYTVDGIKAEGDAVVEDTRQNLIPLSRQYMTLAEAQADIANIPEGSTTYYRSPDDSALAIEVINNGGTLEPTGRKMPSQESAEAYKKLIDEKSSTNSYLNVIDDDGFIGLSLIEDEDGVAMVGENINLSPNKISNASMSITPGSSDFSLEDEEGLVIMKSGPEGANIFGLGIGPVSEEQILFSRSGNSLFELNDSDGPVIQVIDEDGLIGGELPLGPINSGGGDVTTDSVGTKLNALNSSMAAASIRHSQSFYNVLAKPIKQLNVVAVYGQSLALGVESRTVLSTDISFSLTPGNKMLGQAIRGKNFVSSTGTDFSPVGGTNTLYQLQEKLQYVNGNLAPEGTGGSDTLGETVMTGLLTTLKHAHNERLGIDGDDPDHLFVGFCTGNSGTPIAELMKGAPQNYYNRYLTALQGIKEAADAQGYSLNLVAVVFMQGENDYAGTSYDTYKAALTTLMSDLTSDGKAITGQSRDVLEVIYQTGGQYTRDKNFVDIGRAQIDYVLGNKNARFCGPYSPLPTPTTTTHLLANSYRWFGCNVAKCIDKALQGHGKITFRMVGAAYKGDEAYPYFEVPVPPIQLQPAYVISTPTLLPGRGFTITDALGSLSGESLTVDVYSPHILKIKCPRDLVGPVRITLADKANYNGKHNVCDSDSSEAVFPWEYTGTNGQPANENIPELNDKNYVLRNWAAAYSVIADEIED
ncbi:sialate O-acetylesterase [Klebsiella pneumoniae]|uniref:sialate O-acetylesterase n=1 Tax=Klebsiella pneumoniae TaxID=573 RepID=UPI00385B309A|nr:sialate O-acetylesterase [Klebsiella pneumoniae]